MTSAIIRDVDPVNRKVVVMINNSQKTLIVEDNNVLKIADIFRNRGATIVYEERGGTLFLRVIRGELEVKLLGLSKDTEREVILLDKGSGSSSSTGFMDIPLIDIGGEGLIYFLAIILLVIILIAIYFVVVYPLILIISSIFTLGETWKMRRVTKIVMDIDSSSETAVKNVEKLISIAVKNKAAISINPRRTTPKHVSEYIDYTNRIFKLFTAGFVLQAIIIYTSIIVASIIYFLKTPITEGIKYLAMSFGIIYLVGLFLTVLAGYMRRGLKAISY